MTAYITDVAREAGVSVATVSRVLADSGYPVRAETRRRVLAAAAHLGYQPNGLGRSLRVGRSSAIGVCATTLNNPTAVAAVEGVIRACRALNRQVQTAATFSDPVEENAYLRLFLQERVAGVISFPSGAPAQTYQQLQETGAPVVLLNRGVPGLVAPIARHDFAGGYALAVEWLATRGHRRIGAMLANNAGIWTEQTSHWNAAFERLGLQPQPDLTCHVEAAPTTEHMHGVVRELLGRESPPTAIFAGTAFSTLVALRIIATSEIPAVRRIAIVGTGDRRWELLFPPSVPFVCLDSFGLGTTAAQILNDLIDGGQAARHDAEISIPVSFVDAVQGAL